MITNKSWIGTQGPWQRWPYGDGNPLFLWLQLKKTPATTKLKAAFESLKKSERAPWNQKATESNKQAKRKQLDRQLLKDEPDKPLNSGYCIFTAEHMRSQEIKALPSTERIKAVASKWRDLSAYGKKRYEAKKEKLLKDYKKEIDKYRKVRLRRRAWNFHLWEGFCIWQRALPLGNLWTFLKGHQ